MASVGRHIARAARLRAPEICVGTVAADHADLRRTAEALGGDEFSIAGVSFDLGELLLETRDRELNAVVFHCGDSLAQLPALITRLHKRRRSTSIVAVSRFASTQDLRRALDGGLDGLVLDSELQTALPAAVRAACAGQLSIPRAARPRVYSPALTHAEREVLSSVGAGLTNSEIAARLHISPSTVKSRLASAFGKLGVGSRGEAAAAMLDAEGTSKSAR